MLNNIPVHGVCDAVHRLSVTYETNYDFIDGSMGSPHFRRF
jgi:hypothetical protein